MQIFNKRLRNSKSIFNLISLQNLITLNIMKTYFDTRKLFLLFPIHEFKSCVHSNYLSTYGAVLRGCVKAMDFNCIMRLKNSGVPLYTNSLRPVFDSSPFQNVILAYIPSENILTFRKCRHQYHSSVII